MGPKVASREGRTSLDRAIGGGAESRLVKPSQTKSNQVKSNQVKPSQTKSNQVKPSAFLRKPGGADQFCGPVGDKARPPGGRKCRVAAIFAPWKGQGVAALRPPAQNLMCAPAPFHFPSVSACNRRRDALPISCSLTFRFSGWPLPSNRNRRWELVGIEDGCATVTGYKLPSPLVPSEPGRREQGSNP